MYGSVGQRGKIPECFADDFTDMYCTASGFPPIFIHKQNNCVNRPMTIGSKKLLFAHY